MDEVVVDEDLDIEDMDAFPGTPLTLPSPVEKLLSRKLWMTLVFGLVLAYAHAWLEMTTLICVYVVAQAYQDIKGE